MANNDHPTQPPREPTLADVMTELQKQSEVLASLLLTHRHLANEVARLHEALRPGQRRRLRGV